MAPDPDIIVIPSSSPEQNWARSVSPCTPERLFGLLPCDSSPPSLLSPSKLFGSIMSTERRANSQASQSPLREDVGKANIPITDMKSRVSTKKGKSLKTGPKTGGEQKEPKTSISKPKTSARSRKGAKAEETKNKTLTGRVAKGTVLKTKTSSEEATTSLDAVGEGAQRQAQSRKSLDLDDLNLEEAIKRRLDWTPPKSSPFFPIDSGEVSQKSCETSGFGGLLHDYRYSRETSSSDHQAVGASGLPTKRRRIELVERGLQESNAPSKDQNHSRSSSTADTAKEIEVRRAKPALQPKKTKTITALVTSRYEPVDTYVIRQHPQSNNIQPVDESADPSTKKQTRKNKKTTAKPKEPEYIILSPEAVNKSLSNQDLLFGTCSQLETDDHPTLIRETQKTLAASEKYAESSVISSQTSRSTSTEGIMSRFNGTKGLWSAAARNSDGFVVQPEFLDMTDSPNICSLKNQIVHEDVNTSQRIQTGSLPILPEQTISQKSPTRKMANNTLPEIDREKSSTIEPVVKSTERPSTQSSEMPRYTGFTDDELHKQIVSYGFKPVKNRKKMISLLEKCWRSKQIAPKPTSEETAKTSAASTDITNNNKKKQTNAKSSEGAKKPKSSDTTGSSSTKAKKATKQQSQSAPKRSKKSKEKPQPPPSVISVEEIQDSEDETIPSPTRIQMQYKDTDQNTPTASLPLGIQPTSNPKGASRCPSPITEANNNLPNLSNQITKAIRSQPRNLLGSKQGPLPTWHEKILLYDPVILEDFTMWLNTEGLGLIGEDREVSAGFVREWCESKGICCTYRPKVPQ